MHEVVDSLVIPARVAGDPALELCNTRAVITDLCRQTISFQQKMLTASNVLQISVASATFGTLGRIGRRRPT